MDKIFSARVDESVIQRVRSLARRLGISKKQIIENAVRTYAAQMDQEDKFDALEWTCGAWRRKESARRIAEKARRTFRKSLEKHKR